MNNITHQKKSRTLDAPCSQTWVTNKKLFAAVTLVEFINTARCRNHLLTVVIERMVSRINLGLVNTFFCLHGASGYDF